MNSIPNMSIVAPRDTSQFLLAIEKTIEYENPVYFRMPPSEEALLPIHSNVFDIGIATELHSGKDATIIANGRCVHQSLLAARQLKEENISVRVLDMHTIKPLDRNSIKKAAEETGKVIIVEDHNIQGGMGTLVAGYPYLFGRLVDALFYDNDIALFFKIVLTYLVIYIINQILHYCLDIMVAKLRIDYSFDIKKSLFHKVLKYESKKLADLNTGDILSRINKDSEEALNMIYHDLFYGISAFLDFLMCFIILAFINIPLACVSLALVIVTFVLSNVFKKTLRPYYERMTELSASNQNWLFEFLNGMRDIRLINATERCINKYMNRENDILKENCKTIKKELFSDRTNAFIQVLSTLIMFSLAAIFISQELLTLGGLVACIDYFNRMILTLNRMYTKVFSVSKRLVSIERVMEIETEQTENSLQKEVFSEIKKGEISFCNISFSYNKDKKVIDNFNLHIYPGEKIAVVGKSGEGKSTIAELLCRFYDIDEGKIIIDGKTINDYDLNYLRKQVGLVQQNTVIFKNTVRYNLVFNNDNRYDEEIWQILKQVEMDDVIKMLPDGLNTVLSTSNIELSGGQRQRLAIARAYLKKPKILVFDESTSALDGNTEFNIIKSWTKLFPEHTIVVIAHRLSTIVNCDRIAFMENGKIIACDTHTNLLENCESYK